MPCRSSHSRLRVTFVPAADAVSTIAAEPSSRGRGRRARRLSPPPAAANMPTRETGEIRHPSRLRGSSRGRATRAQLVKLERTLTHRLFEPGCDLRLLLLELSELCSEHRQQPRRLSCGHRGRAAAVPEEGHLAEEVAGAVRCDLFAVERDHSRTIDEDVEGVARCAFSRKGHAWTDRGGVEQWCESCALRVGKRSEERYPREIGRVTARATQVSTDPRRPLRR